MALDWISNLFQSEQTRGLSGDSATAVALDDANPYYNYRLRRHKAEGDLVKDPALLWFTSSSVKRRAGLGVHIASEKGEGVATFTDVLVILSHEDYGRAMAPSPDPWMPRTMRTILRDFEEFCQREGFERRYGHRQIGLRILCDGSMDMSGTSLGLKAGEFVTGLLPNLYTGPVKGSFPVIGVHVNLPGAWDGYKEVGRLYNDQILFTLGSHWLDNFNHPSLREAALYRLQQYPDGSFVHIINPDLQDRYQVTSTDQGGASVLTLATRDGQPLAYLVLAVIDPPEEMTAPPAQERPSRPGIPMSNAKTPPKARSQYTGPSIPPPMLIDDEPPTSPTSAAQPAKKKPTNNQGPLGGKTIIPDAPSARIFTLQERGALLQKVHFANFMDGYDVYLGVRGEVGTVVDEKAAVFQVRRKSVSLKALVDGVQVAGYPAPPGVEVAIEGDVMITVAGQRMEYRDLRGFTADGWPYVGEIRRPASSSYMTFGDVYRIGRSRDCRVVLPDEPRNENIQWKAGIGDGATIRARTGDIPKSRFYTDSIMVASEHANIDLRDEPHVECTARHCYVYVRRGNEILTLFPTESGKMPVDTGLIAGDEVLIGNCLFQVGYSPKGQAVAPAPAPKIELSSDTLVGAVAAAALEKVDAAARADKPVLNETAPAAAGLGQRGAAPAPVPLPPNAGLDSILGPAPEFDDEPVAPPTNPKRTNGDFTPAPAPSRLPSSLAGSSAPPAPPRRVLAAEDAPPPPPRPAPVPRPLEASSAPVPPMRITSMSPDSPSLLPPGSPARTVQLYEDDGLDAPKKPAADPWGLADKFDADDRIAFDTDEAPQPPTEMLKGGVRRVETPASPVPAVDRILAPPPRSDIVPETPVKPPPSPVAPPRAEELPIPRTPIVAHPTPIIPHTGTVSPDLVGELRTSETRPPDTLSPTPATHRSYPDRGLGEVVAVADDEAQFELGRRMQLIHVGWTINGRAVIGNHAHSDFIIPENRIVPDQVFEPRDYFVLQVRGRRGSLDLLAPSELLINGDDPKQSAYDEPEKITIDVIRRDDHGDEDFAIRLLLIEDRALPDPRARLLEVDCADPLAAALFTRGLPTRQDRVMEIGGISLNFYFDGETVVLSNYLDTYKGPSGFRPFFVQHGDARFQTAPEDGAPLTVNAGDRLVIGNAVYLMRKG